MMTRAEFTSALEKLTKHLGDRAHRAEMSALRLNKNTNGYDKRYVADRAREIWRNTQKPDARPVELTQSLWSGTRTGKRKVWLAAIFYGYLTDPGGVSNS